MTTQFVLIAAGITALYLGGEVLVRYASALARALQVSPLVIGLTVVAFGTSAPELAAAVSAMLKDSPDLAVGNVVGSNIANIGLILGLTVLLAPMTAERQFVAREVPFMIFTALLFLGFAATGVLARWQGILMLGLLLIFLWFLIRGGRVVDELEEGEVRGSALVAFLGSLAGLALLIGGAELTVTGAQALARHFGVSERLIGLTVVAFGTSVPELAGCMVAAARKQTGLVLGNIVGSNIFNTLMILPTAILIRPIPVSWQGFGLDLAVMVVFSLLLLLFFVGGRRLHRLEGLALFLAYLGYIGLLVSQSRI